MTVSPVGRRAGVGALLALAYVLVTLATGASGRVRVRPLFEGFAPPAPYRWVKPPARFAAGNVKPSGASATIAITGGVSVAGAVATDDGQFLANLGAGAVKDPTATAVDAKVTPVDPATLAPLPARSFADGNAYRLDLTLTPANAAVGTLASPGNVVLTLPAAGTGVAFSPDGRTWQLLTAQPVGTSHTTLGVAFDRPGFYVGVAASEVNGSASSGGGGGSTVYVVVSLAAIVVAVAGSAIALRRRNRPAPGRGPSRQQQRQRARQQSKKRR